MKRFVIPFFTSLTLIFSIFFYYIGTQKKYSISSLHCYAQVQYNYSRNNSFDIMNSGINFFLENGKGSIIFSASLRRDNDVYTIKRDIQVSYRVTENNTFLIEVENINISPADTLPDELAYIYLYGYAREKGGWFNISAVKNNEDGYIIYTTTIPQFYCKKT